MAFTNITITGTYKKPGGAVDSGWVSLTPTSVLINGTDIRAPVPTWVALDGTGTISQIVVATDDAGTTPAGVTYTVTELINLASPKTYNITVPSGSPGGTLDLSAVIPVTNLATGMADGTVGAPAIRFLSEITSGIYRIGAGIIGISILGVERLRLSATELLVSASVSIKGPKPWMSATAYGVVADGVADDTANLNIVTDNLRTLSGAAVLLLPSGTIKITGTWDIGLLNGKTIKGAGQTNTYIKQFTANTAIMNFNAENMARNTFEDFTLLYNTQQADTQTNAVGLQFGVTGGLGLGWWANTFRRITIDGANTGMGFSPAGTGGLSIWNNTFEQIWIYHSTKRGIYFKSPTNVGMPINTFRDIRILNYNGIVNVGGSAAVEIVQMEAAFIGLDIEDWKERAILYNGGSGASMSVRGLHIERHTVTTATQVIEANSGALTVEDGRIWITVNAAALDPNLFRGIDSEVITRRVSVRLTQTAASTFGAWSASSTTCSFVAEDWFDENTNLNTGFSFFPCRPATYDASSHQTVRFASIRDINGTGHSYLRRMQSIAYAATITPNIFRGDWIVVGTLTGNIAVGAVPASTFVAALTGQTITFTFTQDGTGGRTVTWNAVFKTAWQPAPAANAVSSVSFLYDGVLQVWRQLHAPSVDDLGRVYAVGVFVNAATSGLGYGTGAGGAATQITSSATAVTLNKPTGQVTTVALTTAAGTNERFTVNNTSVAATDTISLGTTYNGAGLPSVFVLNVTAGAFDIIIKNEHATVALNALMVINFAVMKAVAA